MSQPDRLAGWGKQIHRRGKSSLWHPVSKARFHFLFSLLHFLQLNLDRLTCSFDYQRTDPKPVISSGVFVWFGAVPGRICRDDIYHGISADTLAA